MFDPFPRLTDGLTMRAFVTSLVFSGICLLTAGSARAEIKILPEVIALSTSESTQQLVVQRRTGEEFTQQVMAGIVWSTSDSAVATVTEDGHVVPVGNGHALLTATIGDEQTTATLVVSNLDQPFAWTYRNHVLPVLTKSGCNSGSCHGTLAGKGGFRLSLRGYDPVTDHFNITQQDQGRRIELSDPGRSLFLAKPSGAIPHRGGLRFETDSLQYRILSEWIAAGAAAPTDADPRVDHIEIFPGRSLHAVGETQQMVVRAWYTDGRAEDVTPWVKWSSTNEAVCQVDDNGRVNVIGPGEGAIVAWYSSQIVLGRITVPFTTPGGIEAANQIVDQRPARNFIDEHIDRQLVRLNLPASPVCSETEFVRRVYVDTIGMLPSVEETSRFLADPGADKRDRLIEELLARPEFVDYWTYKWSDVLMLNGTLLRPGALKAYYEWIRGHVAANTPWDQFVREILTATGNSLENGATNFYALYQSPEDMTENACQAFMGLSIGCARCHNHPLEKWTNDQYFSMANLFARVRAKGWGGEGRSGDGARTLYVSTTGDLVQPRTGRPQPPMPLDGEALEFDDPADRRMHLAVWMTSPENTYFSRAITNRIWANYFGVGLVEQIDDLRMSNPASNEELLSAAAAHLVENSFDLKALMRTILQSNAYQRTSQPLPGNAAEDRFYSRYYPRRIMAEVLHDAVVQVTEVPTAFNTIAFPGADREQTDAYPLGTRAIQLYDSAIENYFLQAFGRNQRRIVCECERSDEPSMVQVLHISNGDTINLKLTDETGRIARLHRLMDSGMSADAMLDELFLSALSRFPTPHERTGLEAMLSEAPPEEKRLVLEDIAWGVMSSREFLFNH